ncbi:hypothetical protein FLJU110815_03410 [Flavobacterium jumunjinense]
MIWVTIEIMKKTLLILCLCFFFTLLNYSQEKKFVFYDDTSQIVTEEEFYKKFKTGYSDLIFENDSIIQYFLIKTINHGKLNDEDFNKVKSSLLKEDEIENEIIVIVYIPGQDSCNSKIKNSTWNIFDRDYRRKLKQITPIKHFWIYKEGSNIKYYYPKSYRWQQDPNQLIESLFFKYHYSCCSAVVIDENGNYVTYFGEFGKREVWKIAQELIDLNK